MDPIRLPSELTSPLFALLHTNQIANCTAVSKEWRNTILTDPIANRVLDLTDKKTLTELETIQLVNRLASLSSHPRKEIHVDVKQFCKSLANEAASQPGSSIGDLMRRTHYSFPSLISTISSATKGKLAKLSLETDSVFHTREQSVPLTLAIVETTLMILDKSIEDLREIQFLIPSSTPFSLVSEGLAEGVTQQRKVSIEGGHRESLQQSSVAECEKVIQAINKFTGGQLKSLVLPHEKVSEAARVRSLFGRIRESRNTLTSLSLGVLVEHDDFTLAQPGFFLETWNLVKTLSSLEKLELTAYSEDLSNDQDVQREEIVDLIIPQDQQLEILQLKELYLSMTGVRLDWESTPLCWIGTSLRILDLSFGSSEVYFENISRSSSDWWVSLLNSNSNLQTLKLSYVKSKGSSIRLVLPNLTSLDLNSMNLEGHCLFFDAHLPKLESLGLDLSSLLDDGNLMEETQSFDHSFFLPILQSCQSTLQSLDIVGQLDSKAASFQKERYRFTRLQTLHLFGTNTIVLDLLSHSQFPRLNNLHTARSLDSPQAAFKILASASLSLEEFGFSEISRTNGQVMPLQYSHDSTQSSFPRLKSLTIRPETAFTKDLFLHATFGELKTLHFILGKSSHQPPFQELVWNDLQCLLRSNASTLKFLWVDGSESKDDNDFDGDQSENSVYLQIPFPQLERMLIESCSNFQIQQILQQPTYYKLADLVIEVYAPISSKFQSELLNLMLRSSATLTYVQISGKVSSDGSGNVSTMGSYLEEETIADGESIEFTLLGELFISGGAALGFLSELSKCSFPELEEFSVPDLPLMDSVLKRIVERSPKLRYLAVTDFEGDPIRDYNIKTNPDMIDELKV